MFLKFLLGKVTGVQELDAGPKVEAAATAAVSQKEDEAAVVVVQGVVIPRKPAKPGPEDCCMSVSYLILIVWMGDSGFSNECNKRRAALTVSTTFIKKT